MTISRAQTSGSSFLLSLVSVLSVMSPSSDARSSQDHLLQHDNNALVASKDDITYHNYRNINTDSRIDLSSANQYLPRNRDLKPRRLIKLLREDFNNEWMSVDMPLFTHKPVTLATVKEENQIDAILQYSANFGSLNNDTLRIFRTWLLEWTSCPVEFRWKDLGPLFWPRYIKEGVCQSKSFCSFPAGMKCVPNTFRKLYILKWKCKNIMKIVINNDKVCVTERRKFSKSGRKNIDCKWKRSLYRVLDGCICSC